MAELFKFRCPECQKLLGVSPRKVGRLIHCPQCGAELIVPSIDDAPSETEEATEFADLGIDLGFASPFNLHPPGPPADRLIDQPGAIEEAIAFLERSTASPFETFDPNPDPKPPVSPIEQFITTKAVADAEVENDDEPEPLVQTTLEPLLTPSSRPSFSPGRSRQRPKPRTSSFPGPPRSPGPCSPSLLSASASCPAL